MSRLDQPQDPLFRRINTSVGFDQRLWPQDIAGSVAHAQALERAGVLSSDELGQVIHGLERVRDELSGGSFEFHPDDEDIHMAVERRLTEIVGPLGGKLHTGRSRNDQVATDLAMFVSDAAERALELVGELMATIVDVAERHADWPMPGYTHLQRAQPVYLGHHLLAYFWMLRRDARRFEAARVAALAEMPLGSGALAGLNWELDRSATADDLGFEAPAPNSIDAVSNRDAALDYLSRRGDLRDPPLAPRLGARDLVEPGVRLLRARRRLRLGLVDHAAEEEPGRGRAPARQGAARRCLVLDTDRRPPRTAARLRKGPPRGQGGALRRRRHDRDVPGRGRADARGLTFNRERLGAAASDEMLAATDIADLLVRRGMPFREAHGVIGGLVRTAVESGRSLSELTREEITAQSELLDDEYYEVLAGDAWLESKVSAGGTASARVAEQIAAAREVLARLSHGG